MRGSDMLHAGELIPNFLQIDMTKAAEHSKLGRADLARYISDWEFAGKQTILKAYRNEANARGKGISQRSPRKFELYVTMFTSRRRTDANVACAQRYQVLKPLPKASHEIQALADKLYAKMLFREEEAIQKLRQVIEFATGDDCAFTYLCTFGYRH